MIGTVDGNHSPNQLAKRSLIIDAAVETMKRDGVVGCTVRAIASSASVTKGTVHYYFADVREVVNAAFQRLTDDYVTAVENVTGDIEHPAAAFWTLVAAYLEPFEAHPSMARLWFDYTAWATRHGFQRELAGAMASISGMFERRLVAVGARKADRGRSVERYLLGTILDLSASKISFDDVFADVARLCELKPPRPGEVIVDHDLVCPLCS